MSGKRQFRSARLLWGNIASLRASRHLDLYCVYRLPVYRHAGPKTTIGLQRTIFEFNKFVNRDVKGGSKGFYRGRQGVGDSRKVPGFGRAARGGAGRWEQLAAGAAGISTWLGHFMLLLVARWMDATTVGDVSWAGSFLFPGRAFLEERELPVESGNLIGHEELSEGIVV